MAQVSRITALLLALTALLDAFLAPQQGTRWTDPPHSSLALCHSRCWLRQRPSLRDFDLGARAALGAVVAVLALEAGALAVLAVNRGSARPSDWASLPPLAGRVRAWSTSLPRRCGALGVWVGTVTGVIFVIAVGAVVGVYKTPLPVAVALYATHQPRVDVRPAHLGAPHRTVTVTTANGLDLAGWYVPSRNGRP